MPGLAQLLRRFRFTGVPGAPAVAGVPGDRKAALEAELAPVFALLEPADREAAGIEAAAAHSAAEQRTRAARQAEDIIAEARARADAERAAATASSLADSTHHSDELLATAQVEVERIARVAAHRLAPLAVRVVEAVLETSVER